MARIGLTQNLRVSAELRPLPGLLHVLGLLALTHQQVGDRVDAALAENPMLERAGGSPCPGCGRHSRSGHCRTCRGSALDTDATMITSPTDEICELAACDVSAESRAAMSMVAAHLTDRGLLDSDPADIAALHRVPQSNVEECIDALRAIGPTGLAERTIGDLLAAQAAVLVAENRAEPWIVDLVRQHLPLVASRDAERVAGLYSVSSADAQRAFDLIARQLRPYAHPGAEAAHRVPPDIVATRTPDGAIFVEVVDSDWLGLRVAPIPTEIAEDPEACAWLRPYQDRANELVCQIDSRAHTLEAVARAAIEYQSSFVDHGDRAHRKLTRSGLAKMLGLSESTVSRAVKGKRVRLPDGSVVDLATMFGKSVAVRAELETLAHNSSMSDRQLSEALSTRGFVVSRRTVAKYRAELGIDACHPRRALR